MFIRTISWPKDQAALLEHVRRVHGPEDYDLMAAWYGNTLGFDPGNCFVIDGESMGEIIAHAMIIPRLLRIGESVLQTAEISMVGVDEPYRGQALAHDLLDALHKRMTERDDLLGLAIGPDFFERWRYEYAVGLYLTSYESDIPTDLALGAGYWDVEHSYERRTADQLGAHNQPVTVRRFYINDLPAVQALYDAECARGHYMIERDEQTWNWQLDYMGSIGRNDPDDFLVAETQDRMVAYARLVTQGPVNWFRGDAAAHFSVIEAAGDHPDAVEALLAEIARTAQAFGVDRIGLFVHPQGTFMRHALARGAGMRAFTGAGYVRLHNMAGALEQLIPALEQRRLNSRYAARAYHLIVTTEHDQAEVVLGMGSPEVVELEVPSTTLVRLLTGWYGFEHLVTGYNERYADLLRVLFPRRDPKIGLADMV